MNFNDKVVMLTGAAGNLGLAVARAFARQGAKLVLIDRQIDDLQAEFTDPDRHLFLQVDLLRQEDATAAGQTTVDRFGRIDVLCNVAGGFRMGEAVHDTSAATWDFLIGLNAGSVLHMTQAVIPHMLAAGSGKIVNVAAFAALRGGAQMGAYAASKSVVIRLTESMAAELRDAHINVNCVLPTIIDTPDNRAGMPTADPSRWVAPGDLANVILFLASEEARAIHGAALPVTGLS